MNYLYITTIFVLTFSIPVHSDLPDWKPSAAELKRLKQEERFYQVNRLHSGVVQTRRFASHTAEERQKDKARTLSRRRSRDRKAQLDNYSDNILPKVQHIILRIPVIRSDSYMKSCMAG
jgi:hypothetical protein